jgi:hypothetical protein
MPPPYNVQVTITRPQARVLINRLAREPEFRQQVEADPYGVLAANGIVVNRGALPERVSLPEPDAILEFLRVAEERVLPETASPLGLVALVIVVGAMPMLERGQPVLDGAG